MKAADITDEQIYDLVRNTKSTIGKDRWEIIMALPQFPDKVINAKLRQMVHKGRLDGCGDICNCRGDFTIPERLVKHEES